MRKKINTKFSAGCKGADTKVDKKIWGVCNSFPYLVHNQDLADDPTQYCQD